MSFITASLAVLDTSGCKRSRGLPSAADGGKRTVSPNQAPNAGATDRTTGTDSTGKLSGASGGTTGADNATNQNRAGAGGGTTAANAATATPPADSHKK